MGFSLESWKIQLVKLGNLIPSRRVSQVEFTDSSQLNRIVFCITFSHHPGDWLVYEPVQKIETLVISLLS